MGLYAILRKKYKRWKIFLIFLLAFYLFSFTHVSEENSAYLKAGEQHIEYSLYIIPFIILLLYTDKYAISPKISEWRIYQRLYWLSPFFAAIIASTIGRTYFWINELLNWSKHVEVRVPGYAPSDFKFVVTYISIMLIAWGGMYIYDILNNNRYRHFLRILNIAVCSVLGFILYDFCIGHNTSTTVMIYYTVRYAIPFFTLFFVFRHLMYKSKYL